MEFNFSNLTFYVPEPNRIGFDEFLKLCGIFDSRLFFVFIFIFVFNLLVAIFSNSEYVKNNLFNVAWVNVGIAIILIIAMIMGK